MPDARLDAVCDALAAQKRRVVCGYVAAIDRDAVTLDEVAGHVGSEVRDRDPRSRSKADREIRTRLHHVGLPKLDDADVIEYDPNRWEVTAGPALSIAVDLARAVEGVPDPQKQS